MLERLWSGLAVNPVDGVKIGADGQQCWGIIRSALRMGISDGGVSGGLKRNIDFYGDQRRLWLAAKIEIHANNHRQIPTAPP